MQKHPTRGLPELLAPAGGREQLEYALHFGADAVYLSGPEFGLRSRAQNFSREEMKDALDYAHRHGARVYVTLNALLHEDSRESIIDFIKFLGEIEVDAVIISDLGVLNLVKTHAPNLEIHVSTQASVTNADSACVWHSLGAKRIVLAREVSIDEIKAIRKIIPDELELEVFVHGAMCMAHSGRCLISNHLTNRDANRGSCTQPCRWKYVLMEETHPGRYLPIEEDDEGSYILDSKDLNMLSHLQELIDAGVDSLKIEGRVKGAFYVATVVNAYRGALEGQDLDELQKELDTVSHRPYSTGFFFGEAEQTHDDGRYYQTHDLVAVVNGVDGGVLHVAQRNRFFEGDNLEVLSAHSPVRSFVVEELINQYGEHVLAANKATEDYTMKAPEFELHAGDIIRRRRENQDQKA